MQFLAQRFFALMPFLFGVGFVAPLTTQILVASGMAAPFSVDGVLAGLALGGSWGAYAAIKGRWL